MPGWHHGLTTGALALALCASAPAVPRPEPPVPVQQEAVHLPPPEVLLQLPPPAPAAAREAVLVVKETYVRAGPDARAKVVGVLQRGARVRVRGCVPADCAAKGAWALLEGDGAVRAGYLVAADDPAAPPPLPPHLVHFGARGGARLHALPEAKSKVLERFEATQVLALVPPETEDAAWLAHPRGGWVARAQLRPLRASALAGEVEPAVPLAFLVRDVKVKGADGAVRVLPRHLRLPVLKVEPERVHVADAVLPRGHVRLAWAHPRPAGVAQDARWVHVDTTEQVLTAYEGDRLVFATLVSTGKKELPTRKGVFRVWLKSRDERMHGVDYDVEEVPDVHYFAGGQALHASAWHGAFGHAVSHGCVNLAPADGKWLMAWAPPVLPPGWHTVVPSDGRTTLVVMVEETKRVRRWEPVEAVAKP